jgi:hypothetical protein
LLLFFFTEKNLVECVLILGEEVIFFINLSGLPQAARTFLAFCLGSIPLQTTSEALIGGGAH